MNINETLKSIISEAKILKAKHIDFDSTIDYVCVYAQNNEEYDELVEKAFTIGTVLKENEKGIYFIPNDKVKEELENVNFFKIRKPDPERKERGDVDFVTDFEKLKETLSENKYLSITKSSDGVELIRLTDPEFKVLVHFPQIALSAELNGESDSDKETNNAQDPLEIEKQKRIQLMADFENYKRRVESERSTFGAIANLGLITDLLEVNDDLNMALNDESLDLERARESIKIAKDKLIGAAKKSNVEQVPVNIGDEFNKEYMEAVTTIADEKNKGKVIAVISSAYKYAGQDNILKAAKVIVGK